MKKYFASSELIINEDGSVFHLHVKPEWLADKVILVGDPGRVALVASHFETKECEVESREFKTITGTYKGKRIKTLAQDLHQLECHAGTGKLARGALVLELGVGQRLLFLPVSVVITLILL